MPISTHSAQSIFTYSNLHNTVSVEDKPTKRDTGVITHLPVCCYCARTRTGLLQCRATPPAGSVLVNPGGGAFFHMLVSSKSHYLCLLNIASVSVLLTLWTRTTSYIQYINLCDIHQKAPKERKEMRECFCISPVYLLHEMLIGSDSPLIVVDVVPTELRNQKWKFQGV